MEYLRLINKLIGKIILKKEFTDKELKFIKSLLEEKRQLYIDVLPEDIKPIYDLMAKSQYGKGPENKNSVNKDEIKKVLDKYEHVEASEDAAVSLYADIKNLLKGGN